MESSISFPSSVFPLFFYTHHFFILPSFLFYSSSYFHFFSFSFVSSLHFYSFFFLQVSFLFFPTSSFLLTSLPLCFTVNVYECCRKSDDCLIIILSSMGTREIALRSGGRGRVCMVGVVGVRW